MTTYANNLLKREMVQTPEFYDIISGGNIERYTSFRSSLTFLGNLYTAAPIKRSEISYDTRFGGTRVRVTAGISETFKQYIANQPVEPAQIRIYRAVNDDLSQYIYLFSGNVKNVALEGVSATATCESKSWILDLRLPKIIYQSNCNHDIYDDGCKVDPLAHKLQASISNISGSDYTAAAFSAHGDNYYDGGWMEYGTDMRFITQQVGSVITVQIPFDSRVAVGTVVTVYPGCDGLVNTCKNRFNNFANFLGMTSIPSRNPCIWGFK